MKQRSVDGGRRRSGAVVVTAAVVITLVLTITAPAPAGAQQPADVPTSSTPPAWAVHVPDPVVYNSATTDRLGNTWIPTWPSPFLTKYGPDGNVVATVPIEPSTGESIWVRPLGTDPHGNVYATGGVDGTYTLGTGAAAKMLSGKGQFLAKFDPSGRPVFARIVSETAVPTWALVSDGVGVVMSGAYNDSVVFDDVAIQGNDGESHAFVARFDAMTGVAQWATDIGSDNWLPFIWAWDLTLGREGRVIVGGYAGASPNDPAFALTHGFQTIACTRLCGFLLDVRMSDGQDARFWSPGSGRLAVTGVDADADGLAIGGTYQSETTLGTGDDAIPLPGAKGAFVTRFSAPDQPVWARSARTDGTYAEAIGVALDARGHVVATVGHEGIVEVATGSIDLEFGDGPTVGNLVLSYDAGGSLRWYAQPELGRGTSWIGRVTMDDAGTARVLYEHAASATITTSSGPSAMPNEAGEVLLAYPADGPMPGGAFHGLTPARILDSRTPVGGWSGALSSATPRSLTVGGAGGVPADAAAAVLNVTATQSNAGSFLTMWPNGLQMPNASNLNFGPGQTISNLVTVPLGFSGKVDIATANGATHVVVDVVGYYDRDATTAVGGELLHPIAPVRALDSRSHNAWHGPLGPAATRPLALAGVTGTGVPAHATSVVMSVAATQGTANTFLRVFPTGATNPNTSNLLVGAGQTRANLVMSDLGTGGAVTFYNEAGSIHVVADVVGYFTAAAAGGSSFHPIPPTRVLDDRTGLGGYSTPWTAGVSRAVKAAPFTAGTTRIFAGATAISANLTATNGTKGSFLTTYPSNADKPNTSTLLFAPGETIPTMVVTGIGPGGNLNIANQLGSVDVILDVNGYYTTP